MGGAENLLLQLVGRLDSTRYRSVVCCIGEKKEIGRQIEEMGIQVHELGLLKKGGYDPKIISLLRDLIRREKVDLVHTHLYHANLYGRLAAKKEKIPAIASVHNSYAKPRWYRHLLNRWLARTTSFITVGSEQVLDDVRRLDGVPLEKLILIPNAIDTTATSTVGREKARRALGFGPEAFLIGTVGRLEEQKGHKHLIEAMAFLRSRHPNMHAVIVGEGRLRPSLEKLICDQGLKEKVILTGQRSNLPDIFVALDLFVMPSLWEGLALAMLSAMAAGLPVIATDVGGVRQALDEGRAGVIIPSGDPKALAEAMSQALLNPDMLEVKARLGRERVKQKYSILSLVDQIQNLYELTGYGRPVT